MSARIIIRIITDDNHTSQFISDPFPPESAPSLPELVFPKHTVEKGEVVVVTKATRAPITAMRVTVAVVYEGGVIWDRVIDNNIERLFLRASRIEGADTLTHKSREHEGIVLYGDPYYKNFDKGYTDLGFQMKSDRFSGAKSIRTMVQCGKLTQVVNRLGVGLPRKTFEDMKSSLCAYLQTENAPFFDDSSDEDN